MELREKSFHTQESVIAFSGAQASRECGYTEQSQSLFISLRTLPLCCCTRIKLWAEVRSATTANTEQEGKKQVKMGMYPEQVRLCGDKNRFKKINK